jgi:low temperature requirement protein LtrA
MTMFGYFYAHIPLVVGIIVAAAGMGTAVGHAWDGLHTGSALALAGGVALYLAGDVAFRRAVRIGPSRIRLGAAAVALAAAPLGLWLAAAEIAALVLAVAAALALEHAATRPDAAVPGLGQSSGD